MNKKIFSLVFFFVCLFVVAIGKVCAIPVSYMYMNCNDLEIDDNADKFLFVTNQVIDSSDTNTKTYKCNDSDFKGWIIKYSIDGHSEKFYTFCNDNKQQAIEGDKCNSGYALFDNGYKFVPDETYHYVLYMAFKDDSSNALLKCTDYNSKDSCEANECAWNKENGFCSNDGLVYLSCGDTYVIPGIVPKISSFAVNFLKMVTPIVLIVMSIISLVKSITAGKEDEIKKAQAMLVKRIIVAAIIFFVISIVQFVMLKVADSDSNNGGVSEKKSLSSCLSCFLNGDGDSECGNKYYKDGYGFCYYVKDKAAFECDKKN